MSKVKSRRMKRYHRELYFPPWTDKSLQSFISGIRSRGSLTFSLHSVEKIVEYCFEHGRKLFKFVFKTIRDDVLKNGSVFEFYATDEEIGKVCFRVTSSSSPVDIVMVISADGVVVTLFVINKEDNHSTLDDKLYERKP